MFIKLSNGDRMELVFEYDSKEITLNRVLKRIVPRPVLDRVEGKDKKRLLRHAKRFERSREKVVFNVPVVRAVAKTGEIKLVGEAASGPQDKFDIRMGVKIALRRIMDSGKITRPDRTIIWNEVLEKGINFITP